MTTIEGLYRRHASRVRRAVQGAVRGVGGELIEDACQDAWLTAIRNQDRIRAGEDEQVCRYVVKTAIRRGWKLASHGRRTGQLDAERPDEQDVEERVLALERLELAGASERQRRMLWLAGLGFSHGEIANATGSTTRTVDRQLQRGRRALGA
jgi:DNA-directed RNA polymerase specialized sigma24 family protein